MQEHFDAVSHLRDAVVVGELDTVAERAEELLSQVDPERYPPDWQPFVTALRRDAEVLRKPASVGDAAARTAQLAGHCGACHTAMDAKLGLGEALEPSEDDSLRAQMQRHQWAVEGMWDGIVAPSKDTWAYSTSVFAGVPGCSDYFPADEHGARQQRLCQSVHAIGRKSAAAKTAEQRVTAYGDFLATCAQCHATDTKAPTPAPD